MSHAVVSLVRNNTVCCLLTMTSLSDVTFSSRNDTWWGDSTRDPHGPRCNYVPCSRASKVIRVFTGREQDRPRVNTARELETCAALRCLASQPWTIDDRIEERCGRCRKRIMALYVHVHRRRAGAVSDSSSRTDRCTLIVSSSAL